MLHRFTREQILPGGAASRLRPVLYNSWEATTFAVNEQGQKDLAAKAAKLGVELFVMDDGWFGARNNDDAGLGDWTVNPKKFPQLHYKVVDKTGDAIVIEFVNGAPKVFDSIGVITNNPTYDWQLTNLRNYVGLQDENHESATFLKKPYDQVSNGTGAIGLPGDFTSPSRFVRATFLLNATLANNTIRTPEEAVLRAFRVLNQFDIPEGSVVEISTPTATSIEKSTPTEKITMEATSWTSMADLRNLRYYYHTMYSRTIRMISLEDIDKHTPMVEHPQPRTIELPSNELILDATDKFLLK